MTTNINVNLLTVTPQRNANTVLQGTTLMSTSGAINQVFDRQAVRTVKGQVIFPVTGLSVATNLIVLNQYEQTPVCFCPGDIIVGFTLANGSTSYPGTNFPNQFSTGTLQFYLHDGRTYPPVQSASGVWGCNSNFTATAGNTVTTSIVPTAFYTTNASIPSVTNAPLVLNQNSALFPSNQGYGIGTAGDTLKDYVYLACVANTIPSVASSGYLAVNITMLVMNSSLAQ
jgi:hypothetical protein